jgi:hypothetical protein
MPPPSKNVVYNKPKRNLTSYAVLFKMGIPRNVTKMQTLDVMKHGDCRVLRITVNVDVLGVSVLHGISPRGIAIGKMGLDKLWTWQSL